MPGMISKPVEGLAGFLKKTPGFQEYGGTAINEPLGLMTNQMDTQNQKVARVAKSENSNANTPNKVVTAPLPPPAAQPPQEALNALPQDQLPEQVDTWSAWGSRQGPTKPQSALASLVNLRF